MSAENSNSRKEKSPPPEEVPDPKFLPIGECIRLGQTYDPTANYADVLSSLVRHLRNQHLR